MKLIVLNLPRELSEEGLADLFKAHGEVKACSLVIDDESGVSKGFGFVEMALDDEAANAITQLHGSRIGRKKLRVKPAD